MEDKRGRNCEMVRGRDILFAYHVCVKLRKSRVKVRGGVVWNGSCSEGM
jgi:hypothetical protein